ncbi:DJ-1/PfpI family protein [Labrys wisconsinensis]|uniref:Intracellular protease/amidase n=1 Tax=Labrys wisconsinensis TaxID=425677 RepID=A0ABU0JGM5_9HYPH|nr:DJ-1/PfpI family protein [Labrys wisconsinensis]MDQ0472621.1 putative intracellular protease/amidase [Labrys wisconsinensis]
MATKRITALLIDAFADWEPALLTAAARTFFDADIAHVTPGAREVVSAGGMRVRPQGDVAGLDPRDYDALVVIGSSQWTERWAPNVAPQLRAAMQAGRIVGVICGATLAAARAGLLDRRAHTSNSLEFLWEHGGFYGGAARYVDSPRAVRDGTLISAPGSAPATFAAAVLASLYPEQGEAIAGFEALCAREHREDAAGSPHLARRPRRRAA